MNILHMTKIVLNSVVRHGTKIGQEMYFARSRNAESWPGFKGPQSRAFFGVPSWRTGPKVVPKGFRVLMAPC